MIINNFSEIFEIAKNLHKTGKLDEAIDKYKDLLNLDDENYQLFYLLGTALLQKERFPEAVDALKRAIKIKKDSPALFNNLGIALSQLNQNEDAIKNYEKALNLKPDLVDSMINLGVAYKNLSKFKDSIKFFNKSLKLSPNNYLLHNNVGNLYKSLGNFEKAHKFYDKAIKLKKDNIEAINNKAELFLQKKDLEKAVFYFEKVLNINPKFDYALGKLIHTKKYLCDWTEYDENLKKIKDAIMNKEKVIEPFPMLSIIDDLSLQLKNVLIYNEFKFKKYKNEKIKSKKKIGKIKIGYFGAEFYNHPVLQLTKDIYKYHNKSKFEVYGFFHGPIKDKLHFKIQKYFTKFFDINNNSIDEVVNLCRDLDINIAINLTGHTADSRNSIYLNRVAPIQISFIGYSGTMGTNFIDYIIGDKILIPEKNYSYYTEKVLNMPNSFFPGPKKIKISEKEFSRKSVNLPNNIFVFGCFSNSYKITPDIFNAWMKILKLTKNSVLWLLNNNEIAKNNLISMAQKNGINSARIIFAKKLSYGEHLKRFELMDLSLDTFPYNGHTTTSEAIRCGVPTVTLSGESFTSRVSASLLHEIGLESLISRNIEDYIKIACEVASNRNKYQSLKKRVKENNKRLFSSKKYTNDLEKIYENLVI